MRLRAQRLLPGFEVGSVEEAARDCLSIQAQDPPAAALAVRARTDGLTAEQARGQAADGSVLRAWLMRNTIHMFAAADLAWMRPLLAERPLRPAERRLDQLGVKAPERARVLTLLGERVAAGPLPRSEARRLVMDAGIDPGDGSQRLYWMFHLAAIQGVIAVAPALSQKQSFVAAPADEPLPREEGYARLASRFLAAYGPATPRDMAYWGKVTVTDARKAFEAVGDLERLGTELGDMWALAGTADVPELDRPVVTLLPVWENYLLGYEDRSPAVPPPHDRMPGAGKPVAVADGRAFGHWRLEREEGGVAVVVEPFGPLPRGTTVGLESEAADVGRFIGHEAKLTVATTE
jgi:hypothetical protein